MVIAVASENQEIRVRGTVQGVGFRPVVYRLATECQLYGEVFNDTEGVLIRLSGIQNNIQIFLQRLQTEAPPLAKVDSIEAVAGKSSWHYQDFRISHSSHSKGHTEVTADAASCKACLEEVTNPRERRYLYPFTNCTHCGPRLSIIQAIPYDRNNSTMSAFPMCAACLAEYSNPLDRRFHAQPIACHECGPILMLHSNELDTPLAAGTRMEQSAKNLHYIVQMLRDGKVIAIKGLGGFHLCCDASNHRAVSVLRARKQRYAKPFALMCRDLHSIKEYCEVSDLEQEVLQSAAAPIVLLQKKTTLDDTKMLPDSIAPGSNLLGFMLPSTPLHSLICQQFGCPLVMTSGNLSGEPQIIDNDEAIEKLGVIADLIVYHNRDIANRIDDSVVRYLSGRVRVVRRARGYAPRSITLPDGFKTATNILAYGAELKSTFCLVKQGVAILSQHQGDLEDITTANDYEKNLALYKKLFEFKPDYLAFDRHPEYLSNKLARHQISEQQLPGIEIQHHHAHIASAMAENLLPLNHPRVLGIALDGLGLGDDDTLWGGEFLFADYCSYQRVAHLKPVAMPGAAQAVKQPWRNTYAQLLNSMSWDSFCDQFSQTPLADLFQQKPIATLHAMLTRQINCPMSSSTGRLFDAVAGALGLCADQVHYEGQAAIELEMHADPEAILHERVSNPYIFSIEQPADSLEHSHFSPIQLNPKSIWPELLNDLQQGESRSVIASRFHAGFINGIAQVVECLQKKWQFSDVVLSGGCMQNAILSQGLEQALQKQNLRCITHSLVPANDGGIALGQAVIAAARIITKNKIK
jgi:hydrogenase maturation protein HypF